MAYHNVGVPRFYVDSINWLSSLGFDMKPAGVNVGINPSNLGYGSEIAINNICRYGDNDINIPFNIEFTFMAVLGHNHSGIELYPHAHGHSYADDTMDNTNYHFIFEDIINSGADGGIKIRPVYDGFYIAEITIHKFIRKTES